MAGRLDGKGCGITGAGGGMGREGAIVFTEEGAKVCVADVALAPAEETVGLCAADAAFAYQVDVADEDAVHCTRADTHGCQQAQVSTNLTGRQRSSTRRQNRPADRTANRASATTLSDAEGRLKAIATQAAATPEQVADNTP